MAEFVAFKAQNMNDLAFDEPGSYFVFKHTAGGHEIDEFQVKSNESNLVIDFFGIFSYKHVSGTYVLMLIPLTQVPLDVVSEAERA